MNDALIDSCFLQFRWACESGDIRNGHHQVLANLVTLFQSGGRADCVTHQGLKAAVSKMFDMKFYMNNLSKFLLK